MTVRIVRASSVHPANVVSQADAAEFLSASGADARRTAAIARGSRIAFRQTVIGAGEVASLGSIEDRNAIYRARVLELASAATCRVLRPGDADRSSVVATSSCTGYQLPGLSGRLVSELCLPPDVSRLPFTESGCAGGVVALSAAATFLERRPGSTGLAIAAELCSLAFHASSEDGILTSNMIFGDGAGAALLESGEGGGIEVVDIASVLVAETGHALGFDLTDGGFVPVVDRALPDLLAPAFERAVGTLLCRRGVSPGDVGSWLIHPGGARILERIEDRLGLARCQTAASWSSLREHGNTSSAAIFDVLSRYLDVPPSRPSEWVVIAAFGPGVSIDLILGRRSC